MTDSPHALKGSWLANSRREDKEGKGMATDSCNGHRFFFFLVVTVSLPLAATQWINHGGGLNNWRNAVNESLISVSSAPRLALKWRFIAGADITATPAIYEGTLYFPCWNGNLYAISTDKGELIWEKNLTQLTGIHATGFVRGVNVTVARATPTVVGGLLIVGLFGPATVIALNRSSGELLWSTLLDSHPRGLITMSGTADEGGFYVGVSSSEEELNVTECCTFQGSFAKLNVSNGHVLWKTPMLPDNKGMLGQYSGVAVWGSSPSIDTRRNSIYIATGNLYTAPPDIEKCQEQQNNKSEPDVPDPCIKPENHENSIISLDMSSGNIKWARQLGGYDAWFSACSKHAYPNCPPGPSPDADFGECPMLLTIIDNNNKKLDIVVAGQKTGFVWALDCDNGNVIWSAVAGPGGPSGGGNWGSATDGERIYTNVVNGKHLNFSLAPSHANTTAGGWVAINASTGSILWSTADPRNSTANAPVTVANGVLFAGSMNPAGPVYALDTRTGSFIWEHETNGSSYGGFSVSNGCAYVGSGYKVNVGLSHKDWTSGNSLFAFCLNTSNIKQPDPSSGTRHSPTGLLCFYNIVLSLLVNYLWLKA